MRLAYFAILICMASPLLGQTKGNYSPDVLYARCKTSFVTIWTFDANRAPLGQGSGFIVGRNRVATNYHVLAGSTSASVAFDDGSMARIEAVVAGSAPKDLVVVEVETGNRPALTLGDELQLRVGETVYAIGSPKGLSASLSSGLVSAFRQDEGQFLIQITDSIAPGSSGGPLLNTRGQVVGVTSSRLKDGSFGFAVGASDLQHLLKVPLSVKLRLSDLPHDDTATPVRAGEDTLARAQALFDQKKYDDARAAFNSLTEQARKSFDGELLLCKIEQEQQHYSDSIQACDAAIQSKPNDGSPYGLKAYSLFFLGNVEEAETSATKAVELTDEIFFKKLLGTIHYTEEKYQLVPKDLPRDSNDDFVLNLLAGAALHNHDYDEFRQFVGKLRGLKGEKNGWTLFMEGLAAQKDLKWDAAIDKYRKCDADNDFIDPICVVSLAGAENSDAQYDAAKRDIDVALSHYPKNHSVLSEAIFINLKLGNVGEADRLHETLQSGGTVDEATDCLYYYGRNQAILAVAHCVAAIRANENSYVVWSNAGYAELDNGDFQTARSYFGKASQLFGASKEKHTGTQEMDLYWGLMAAGYYSGDRKDAKTLYRALKKDYPQFMTTADLKQLPLVWSDTTLRLINKIIADFR